MSFESIATISNLTGMARDTVSRKIRNMEFKEGPRGAKLFNTVDALPKIYISDDPKTLDLQQARAVLATKQTEKIDLDIELRRGAYLEYDEVLSGVNTVFTAVRAKLLSLPTKAVPRLEIAKSKIEQEKLLLDLVHEALNELAIPDVVLSEDGKAPIGSVTDISAAAPPDSK